MYCSDQQIHLIGYGF